MGVAAKPKTTLPDSIMTRHFQVGDQLIEMQRVDGGTFVMGATTEQYDREMQADKPAHLVSVSTYYIARTEVTNALWRTVMQDSLMSDGMNIDDHPVSNISWNDCQTFIARLNALTGLTFRLPTEAEWEYAARGGNKSSQYRFAGSNIIDSVAWTYTNSQNRKHGVGRLQSNELGLYDMTGNVSEWCHDWFAPYQLGTPIDPIGPDSGTMRVARGGSFDNCVSNLHLSLRNFYEEDYLSNYLGFRLAISIADPSVAEEKGLEPVRWLRIQKKRVKMLLVVAPDSVAYYISDASWRMKRREKKHFVEACRAECKEAIDCTSEEEVEFAKKQGLVSESRATKRKVKRWEKDKQSVQKHRQRVKKAAPWLELVGKKVVIPDDPILLGYTDEEEEEVRIKLKATL